MKLDDGFIKIIDDTGDLLEELKKTSSQRDKLEDIKKTLE